MAKHNLTDAEREERRQLTNARQNAVRQAWKEEQDRVKEGKGTRNWSVDEQKELLETGRVKGYEGHHMKSVSEYPKEAGNPQNIQFLSEDEHLNGAHQGSYHNATNGYYDPDSGTMKEFSGDELEAPPEIALSDTYSNTTETGQNSADYMGSTMDETGEILESSEAGNYMGTVDSSADSANEDSGQSADNSNEME